MWMLWLWLWVWSCCCYGDATVLAAVTVVNIPEPMMWGFAVDVPCWLWRSPGCCAVIRLPTAVVTVAVVGSCFKTATWLWWLWCCCDSSCSCWDHVCNVRRYGICGGCCDAMMAVVMLSVCDYSDLEGGGSVWILLYYIQCTVPYGICLLFVLPS